MRYSDKFQEYSGQLPAVIESAIEEIKEHLSIKQLRILKYSERHILIPLVLKVNLPANGVVDGNDIREEEPILLRLNIAEYPYRAPTVHSDRMDFPSSFLPHMYVQNADDLSGAFCLVRNDMSEWFGNARISDLLVLAEQWLYKAGSGLLATDGGEFDPLRLEGYRGYHIYKYDMLAEVVTKDIRFNADTAFALMFTSVEGRDKNFTWKTISPVIESAIGGAKKVIENINGVNKNSRVRALFSIVVWDPKSEVVDEYATLLPRNYKDLRAYFVLHGIEIDEVLKLYSESGCRYTNEVPIIHAIRRSKKLVGYDGEYEFINFVINVEEGGDGIPKDDSEVLFNSHIEPMGKELSAKLTGEDRKIKSLYIGGGSLGSKIMLHDVRGGKTAVGVVDDDVLLQHNLVRHGLFSRHVGKNKAEALTSEADDMYKIDLDKDFKSFPKKVHELTEDEISFYDSIVDTTASVVVQNWLTENDALKSKRTSRCELADSGRLGLLYTEGENRNPRIDDLINLTYYKAKDNSVIRQWRKNDSISEVMNLSVGLGCSSTTTVLADDVISLHAAIFSKVLYKQGEAEKKNGKGLLYRSVLNDADVPGIYSEYEYIDPFEILICGNASGWQMRMANGLSNKLIQLCRERGKIETGGVLVGIANYKTKTIHVFEIVEETQDSKGTSVSFIRGVKGLPEYIDQIKEVTGGVIGYVGEWHTHPMDLEQLSGVDLATIEKLKVVNRTVPIPTCSVIVTNDKVLPFVYE